jgi:hypothetical protein
MAVLTMAMAPLSAATIMHLELRIVTPVCDLSRALPAPWFARLVKGHCVKGHCG